MGSFFVDYFLRRGHTVTGSDPQRGKETQKGFRRASSNSEAVEGADVVLVAVPVRETAAVVREVAPSLKEGCTLVEISSIKGRLGPELRRMVAPRRVSLLSVHPMFGPSSRSRRPKMLVVGGEPESSAAARIFPDAELIRIGPREHDRLMAYTLSLVHLTNVAFVSTLVDGVGVQKFERAAPPIASAQLDVARAVLSQDPALYSYVDVEGEFVSEALSSLITEISALKSLAERKDFAGFERRFSGLARRFRRPEMEASLGRVYSRSES
jgi:prephenate dehydrogenase